MNHSEWLDLSPGELKLACEVYKEEEERRADFLARVYTGKGIKKSNSPSMSQESLISFFKNIKEKK